MIIKIRVHGWGFGVERLGLAIEGSCGSRNSTLLSFLVLDSC